MKNVTIRTSRQHILKQSSVAHGKSTEAIAIAVVPTRVVASGALEGQGVLPQLLPRERSAPARKALAGTLGDFIFQPFKRCFNSKCRIVFVPGDFKPSSPRRMFCSSDCFAEHWREQLALVFTRDLSVRSLRMYQESTQDSSEPVNERLVTVNKVQADTNTSAGGDWRSRKAHA